MQVALQEAQEEAVQAAFSVYNSEAVGNGVVRRNHEKQLHATLKRQFEVLFFAVDMDSLSICFAHSGWPCVLRYIFYLLASIFFLQADTLCNFMSRFAGLQTKVIHGSRA